jgi:ABC-type hemin transport system ATPase subunit
LKKKKSRKNNDGTTNEKKLVLSQRSSLADLFSVTASLSLANETRFERSQRHTENRNHIFEKIFAEKQQKRLRNRQRRANTGGSRGTFVYLRRE